MNCEKRILLLLLLLLLTSAQIVTAQQQSNGDLVRDDAQIFVDDAKEIFSAPANFDGTDWFYTGLVLGATGLASMVDEDVRTFAQQGRSDARDSWLLAGDYYGNGWSGALLGFVLYGGGLAAGDEWTRVTGRALLQSMVYAGLINQLMKMTFGRARPYTDEGAFSFHFLRIDRDHKSFPSGHSSQAFAMSATLSRRIGNTWASVGLYALASLTVVQRISSDDHWLSDTVLGAALGTAVGFAVAGLEEERQAADEATAMILSEGARPHKALLSFNIPF